MADNVGAIKYGCETAQLVSRRFLGAFASEAALTNLALAHRADGGVAVITTGPSWWQYSISSELTESPTVRAPDDGVGRWIAMGAGGGVGPAVTVARVATATALAASTRTVNVRVANANGAMGTIDGVTMAVGDIVLDKDNATGADRGLWIIDSLGAVGAKWQMTRAPAMDTSDDCVPGMLIAVAEGTANGDKTFTLTTNAAITLNTTSLAFATVAVTAATVSVADTEGLLAGSTAEACLAELAANGGSAQVAVHNVRGASTANLASLSGAGTTIDGITYVDNERILLKDQGTASQNGIYVWSSIAAGVGDLTRATDFDSSAKAKTGTLVKVSEGTASADTLWQLTTNAPITLGTTGLTFKDVVHDVTGAASGSITDADSVLSAGTLEDACTEMASGEVARITPVHDARGASTANLASLSGAGTTIDGITYVDGERILLKDQAAPEENGIYEWSSIGAGVGDLTRAPDFDSAANVKTGVVVSVSEGTANADTLWRLSTNAPITVGTTGLTFAEVWTAARGLATAGAAQGALADADGCLTATKIEDGFQEVGTAALPFVGLYHKCRGASTANLAAFTGVGTTIDGITYVNGERIFVKDQTAGEENGIYVWSNIAAGVGDLTRATDFDNAANVCAGALITVSEGTASANTVWKLDTNDPITVGTTALVFVDMVHDTTGAAAGAIADAGALITATTLEGMGQELAGDIDTICPGVPMINRLFCNGLAGAAIANGDTVTIGGDVYEFRNSTPPAGGTAGRIWVYQGANAAASRTNLINAINNVTDAPNITYDGAVTEAMWAQASPVAATTIEVVSATAIGSTTAAPSATATACTETLTQAADVWDAANMYGGKTQTAGHFAATAITLSANEITLGSVEIRLTFTPTACDVHNRDRDQIEAYTITGNAVSLTLAGGGAPNNTAGDVLEFRAYA